MMRLKKLREEKGVIQQVVADMLCITRAAYTNIENGKREPDVKFRKTTERWGYIRNSIYNNLRRKRGYSVHYINVYINLIRLSYEKLQ